MSVTVTDTHLQTASAVLARCAGFDPWFPGVGDAAIHAWAEVFASSRLSAEDLLAGVERAYRLNEDGYRPLPGSIVTHARAAYYERLHAMPKEQLEAIDETCHVLQDMGRTPNEAHRMARRMALGRAVPELTDAEYAELSGRLAERRALRPAAHRAVAASDVAHLGNLS